MYVWTQTLVLNPKILCYEGISPLMFLHPPGFPLFEETKFPESFPNFQVFESCKGDPRHWNSLLAFCTFLQNFRIFQNLSNIKSNPLIFSLKKKSFLNSLRFPRVESFWSFFSVYQSEWNLTAHAGIGLSCLFVQCIYNLWTQDTIWHFLLITIKCLFSRLISLTRCYIINSLIWGVWCSIVVYLQKGIFSMQLMSEKQNKKQLL